MKKQISWLKENLDYFARKVDNGDVWHLKKYGSTPEGEQFVYMEGPRSRVSLPISFVKRWMFSEDGGQTFPLNLFDLIDKLGQ